MFRIVSTASLLESRVAALEAELGTLRAEWRTSEAVLEELHRRNLNTIRSLRRLARLQDAPEDAPGDTETLELMPEGVYVPPEMRRRA